MMRSTATSRAKRHAQRAALETGEETFVWPCAIHGERATSDSQCGWCIECRAMAIEARTAERDRAAAQLREKHLKRPPRRNPRTPPVSPWKPREVEMDPWERILRVDA